MDLNYSAEQDMLRESVERFMRDVYAFTTRQKLLKQAWNDGAGAAEARAAHAGPHWRRFAELGWLAVPFTEDDGGIGGGPVDFGIVMEGIGRGLAIEPVLPTVLAARLVAELGTADQKASWLTPALEGRKRLALAFAERQSRYDLTDCATTATASGATASDDGWVLDGAKAVVLGGHAADGFVVVARSAGARRDADGISLFLVDADAAGLSVRAYRTNDGTGAADISLRQVAVPASALLGRAGQGAGDLERAVDFAIAAVASEAVGVMAALCEQTLEYLKTRRQFGRPLGDNQVLQHRMVDMVIATEEARSAALHGALMMAVDDPRARARALSLTKIEIGRTATRVGQEAVQLHGAMGVTEELAIGHYFKRLTAIAASFGDIDWHTRRVARIDAGIRAAGTPAVA
ncbi:acyl-CoA dehydrogenase (plasmid) [Tistrella bauzanensis]|uniref:acyl-CoA dehydrogenase family protein n=1 Tax=Tistrella TaxID=171436 RepID=UPI0031F6890C